MAVLNRCRELCLASVYALALTGVAGAADLAVKAPIVPPVPVFRLRLARRRGQLFLHNADCNSEVRRWT